MNEIADKIIEHIRSYKEFADGWNGYDALAPTEKLLSESETFYQLHLLGKNIKTPGVSLSSEEELMFYWNHPGDDIYVDIELWGDGTYTCFGEIKEAGKILWFDEVPIDTLIPKEILALISL